MRLLLFIAVCFVCRLPVNAKEAPTKEQTIESLRKRIRQEKNDTVLIKLLVEWDNLIYASDVELDFDLNARIERICERNLKRKGLGKAEKRFFLKAYCKCKNVMGIYFDYQGNRKKAIQYHTQSLKIAEQLGDVQSTANSLSNIGSIYMLQGNYEKALSYHKKSLALFRKGGFKTGEAMELNNIGSVYESKKMYDEALKWYQKSLAIKQNGGDLTGVVSALGNIGVIYTMKGRYEEAIKYQEQSLAVAKENGFTRGIANAYGNMGTAYAKLGNIPKATALMEEGLEQARKLGEIIVVESISKSLYEIYKETGKFKEALDMRELYIVMRDSLRNEEAAKEIATQEYEYEYDKKATADAIKRKQEKENDEGRLRIAETFQLILVVLIGLTLVFGIFMFNRFRIIRRQKKLIEEQKLLVEEQKHLVEVKQREIIESIHYAKRIQEALLSSPRYIDRQLKTLRKS